MCSYRVVLLVILAVEVIWLRFGVASTLRGKRALEISALSRAICSRPGAIPRWQPTGRARSPSPGMGAGVRRDSRSDCAGVRLQAFRVMVMSPPNRAVASRDAWSRIRAVAMRCGKVKCRATLRVTRLLLPLFLVLQIPGVSHAGSVTNGILTVNYAAEVCT